MAAPALRRTPQPAEGITYAHKVDKAEASIDWAQPAATIERRVRAFDPFPGASFRLGDEAIKLWRAKVLPGQPGAAPGQVLQASAGQLHIACGDGALRLTQLQYPGGRRIDAPGFLRARPIEAGDRLA